MPALLLALGFLMPLHELPWTGFHGDLFAAAALGLLAWQAPPTRWPVPALAVLALSVIPLVQHATGLVAYRGDAVMATLYLAGLAFAIHAGAASPDGWREVARGLLFAAWASAALALSQAAGLLGPAPWLGPQHPGGRAVANLAQPNLLASLLALGLTVQLAGWPQGRLRRLAGFGAGAALLVALALTGSRSGLLQAALVLGTGLALGPRAGQQAPRADLAGLASVLILSIIAVQARPAAGGRSWLDGESASVRGSYWQLFADAVQAAPWAGHGFNQVSVAQSRQMLLSPSPAEWAEHTHNLALDLLVWCGLPLGLGVLALLVWSVLRGLRTGRHQATWVPTALGLGVLLIHAMLEYPLDYFLFLFPFGVMLGSLWGAAPAVSLAGAVHRTVGAALALATLIVVLDYRQLRPRLDAARSHSPAPAPNADAHAHLLDQIQAQIDMADYMNGKPLADLAPMEAASERFAYPAVLLRLQRDALLRGDTAMAARMARRLTPSKAPPHTDRGAANHPIPDRSPR